MGLLKATFDKSTDWAANRGGGKVVMSTKNDTRPVAIKAAKQCSGGCGRKAQITKGKVRLCGRSSCDS